MKLVSQFITITNMPENVFVIIATFNGKRWYDRCFSSLRASEIPLNVVVIDNASSDDTGSYLKSNFPEIHLIESEKNLGFGQGNNIGIRYAMDQGADYVFLLNQDAWIEPDTLLGLVGVHKKHLEFGILSPMHLNLEKTEIEKGLMHYIADFKIIDTGLIDDLYFGRLSDLYETQYVNAAAWLLPRHTLETVGGFDPIFFHYGEDDNYIHRVKFHGLKIGICPKVSISHDTERRVIQSKFSSQNAYKFLLVELTNINEKALFIKSIIYYCRKSLNKLLKFYFQDSKILFSKAKFILYMKTKIKNSRTINKRVGRSWL